MSTAVVLCMYSPAHPNSMALSPVWQQWGSWFSWQHQDTSAPSQCFIVSVALGKNIFLLYAVWNFCSLYDGLVAELGPLWLAGLMLDIPKIFIYPFFIRKLKELAKKIWSTWNVFISVFNLYIHGDRCILLEKNKELITDTCQLAITHKQPMLFIKEHCFIFLKKGLFTLKCGIS